MKKGDAYERFVRPLLFSLDPETAHNLAIRCLSALGDFPFLLRALQRFQPPRKPKTVFGITFPHPVGLAAGFDKNGLALPGWAALGFGFVEIGTVTARPQPGNPKPRIFRVPHQKALINRLGFNNDGADVVADRLRELRESGRWPQVPVGINIGKSQITPLETAAEDYVFSFRRLAPFADYVALNVSSPNTPGLRSLQEKETLAHLLGLVRKENQTTPILVKIAPDLAEEEIKEIIDVCQGNEIAGLIATNTTMNHAAVPAAVDQEGGLSGAPLREKSTAVVRFIRSRSQMPIIASGGIFDAESAREKIDAGADLLQIYTGYVYRGPRLLRDIVEQL